MLEELGARICILGPSNSGKSTLAAAIGRARGLSVVHLDQLYHYPNTDWQARPEAEFVALHDAAIAGAGWVMDGNYSRCLPRRLARATGVILLDTTTVVSLLRYFRRTWFAAGRQGGLDGGRDSVKWEMLRHITMVTPGNRRRYREMFEGVVLPKVGLFSGREIARFYREEGLAR